LFLESNGYTAVGSDPDAPRVPRIWVTPHGDTAREAYKNRLNAIEAGWRTAFGARAIDDLRALLEPLVGDDPSASPLLEGLIPYPDGWRARTGQPAALPHSPMVLHRGGYPDGA
jgi:hypothetical protein